MPRALLTPRWIITTLLVAVAVGVMARLGVWQLDRLAERRAFNTRVEAQIDAPALDLNGPLPVKELYNMEYRAAEGRGVYDPDNEIILRNQYRDGQPGYHLLTPLVLEGGEAAILVDRGFIALEEGAPERRAVFAQEGPVTVRGILRRGLVPRYFGVPDPTLAPGETRLDAWNAMNLTRIRQQMPYPLLPVYLQAAPESEGSGPPYAAIEQPELSEGPHFGYALQWFAFAAVLGFGYPFFVRKNLRG